MKSILLLSGGIDSPAAAHLMQRKGYDIVALHFYNKHIGDSSTKDKCLKLCQILNISKIYFIAFDEQQAEIVRKCTHRYYYILQRRLMWRIAEKIAERESASSLITGDNIAQVASQTVSNMTNIQRAVTIPILRPLLCNDKIETMKLAKEIGTYELSAGPEICCLLGPDHPATHSDIKTIELEEQKIDVDDLVKQSLELIEVVTQITKS
ncbi:MAG TPA: 7-cyano-7-deazaguanine synthase [Candidatus Nanoarchaeia archaeon]|nr:7-cyano-7-deazaguanine synthase [Candidatus Nanoarchaeia archaeon]